MSARVMEKDYPMSGRLTADPYQSAQSVAEILSVGLPTTRANMVEIEVRHIKGGVARGPARLLSRSGERAICILGVHFYDGRSPHVINPPVGWIAVEGITANDIEPGQLLVQGDDAS